MARWCQEREVVPLLGSTIWAYRWTDRRLRFDSYYASLLMTAWILLVWIIGPSTPVIVAHNYSNRAQCEAAASWWEHSIGNPLNPHHACVPEGS